MLSSTVNQTRTFIILFSCSIKVVVGAVILVDTHGRERSSATTRASSRDICCRIRYPISLCSHFSSLSTSERVIRPETIWQQTFPPLIYFFFRFSSLSSSTLSRRGGSHSLVQRQRRTGGTNGLGTNHRVKIFFKRSRRRIGFCDDKSSSRELREVENKEILLLMTPLYVLFKPVSLPNCS